MAAIGGFPGQDHSHELKVYQGAKPVTCTCGIPNKANWYVHVVLSKGVGSGTETQEVDIYVCNEHLTIHTRSMVNWDTTGWAILEQKRTELR